jgi:hypothetical protein
MITMDKDALLPIKMKPYGIVDLAASSALDAAAHSQQ